ASLLAMTTRLLRPRRQRLLDLGLEYRGQIVRGDGAHQFVGDAGIAADYKGLRHAIDAPFDPRAAVLIGARRGERIAVAAEEAPGVVGLVLVIDSDQTQTAV